MSEREKEIAAKIAQLEKEKQILEGTKAYYEQNLSYNELEELTGISIREFKRFQSDNEFPYRAGSYNRNAIFEKIRQRIASIEKESVKLRESVFGALDQLLFIPSWQKLIDSNFNGFYLNQPVQKIFQDNVILLPELALTGFEETTGEPFFLITGLGIYWVKFQLGVGSIVTDYREITGIVLPLDQYERAQDEAGQVVSSEKMRMTQYMTSIPFSLILAKSTTQMYLRGIIARNIFHPNKESFDQFLALCKDRESFAPNEGLKILSGGLSTNKPLYSNELLTEKPLGNYSNLIAGIKNTQPKLNKILDTLQIGSMSESFFKKLNQMKVEFSEIGRDYLIDWMPGHIS
ncbi:MAG: hypothetical protein ACXACP_03715 [Candidatus Hodarchaeales archaeon]|jgi:hypothetical protein